MITSGNVLYIVSKQHQPTDTVQIVPKEIRDDQFLMMVDSKQRQIFDNNKAIQAEISKVGGLSVVTFINFSN